MERAEKYNRNPEHGFSIVELMVVIAILAIGATLATLGFTQWQNKSRAEAQVRAMATDFNELRVRAISSKQPVSVTLYSTSYVLKAYTPVFPLYSSVGQQTILPDGTRTVKFPLNKSTGAAYDGEFIEIDERGAIVNSPPHIIFLGGEATQGALNCLTVDAMRINVGKNTGTSTSGVCNDR